MDNTNLLHSMIDSLKDQDIEREMRPDTQLTIITTYGELEQLLMKIAISLRNTYRSPLVEQIELLRSQPFYSPKQVAMLYPVTVGALTKMRQRGKGPRFNQEDKDNPKSPVYYSKEDLDDYFTSHKKITFY